MEFMFWGSFLYDKKGPCHIWTKETAVERKKANEELAALNAAREETCCTEWELTTGMRWTGLWNLPGKKPEWKFNKKNGKLVREGKARGIDWYHYG